MPAPKAKRPTGATAAGKAARATKATGAAGAAPARSTSDRDEATAGAAPARSTSNRDEATAGAAPARSTSDRDEATVVAEAAEPSGVEIDPPARSAALVPVRGPEQDGAGDLDDQMRRSDVDEWGRSESFRDFTRRVYDPMYRNWFRVEWEGFDHIPADGGALLVSNHAGAIPSDAPAIMHGIETELGRPVYGLADEMFKKLPVVGTLWSRAGGVLAHPDNAYRLLREQQQLALVFPEGTKGTGKTYGERYQLRRFGRGGYVQIAMRAGVPIIPLAVVGSEESMPILANNAPLAKLLGVPYVPLTANMLAFGPLLGPLGGLLWFPAKIRIRVLPPIHLDVEPDQHRYSRSRIMDESENVRQQIQEALYDMLRRRRSVWSG